MVGPSRSRPVSATVGTVFGGLWALIAAMALPPAWRSVVTAIAALATALLIWRLWRKDQRTPSDPERLFGRRAYQIAVAAELVAIYVASIALSRLGWQAYLIQTVGIIVGLHFIGLWVATGSRRFLAISGGMCAISTSAILLPAAGHILNERDFFTGAGNALILWIGASRASGSQALKA